MHFDFTISLGNVITILGGGLYLFRLDRMFTQFLVEHEMLMAWYCKEHDVEPKDLPTRVGRRH